MTTVIDRRRADKIVRAARSLCWSTPYVHQGRAGGAGVDCAGFLKHAAAAGGCIVADQADYARETDGGLLLSILNAVCDKIGGPEHGGAVVFRIGRGVFHTAIVATDKGPVPRIVHASSRFTKGVAREEELTDGWLRRVHSWWRLKPID